MNSKKCGAKNPQTCRFHGSVSSMNTTQPAIAGDIHFSSGKASLSEENVADFMVSSNIKKFPHLNVSERLYLLGELQQVSAVAGDYKFNYDDAPLPFTRDGEEAFLDSYDPSKYGVDPNSVSSTADNIIFTKGEEGSLKVLLIQRGGHPFKNYWCLPGGFVDNGEDPIKASVRELQEETSMEVSSDVLQPVKTYSHPWRDPRMKNIHANSFVTFLPTIPNFEAADDASDAVLVDVKDIFTKDSSIALGFDHKQSVLDSVKLLLR